jgi:hypothetical protein
MVRPSTFNNTPAFKYAKSHPIKGGFFALVLGRDLEDRLQATAYLPIQGMAPCQNNIRMVKS